jgi:hypothetical protein
MFLCSSSVIWPDEPKVEGGGPVTHYIYARFQSADQPFFIPALYPKGNPQWSVRIALFRLTRKPPTIILG